MAKIPKIFETWNNPASRSRFSPRGLLVLALLSAVGFASLHTSWLLVSAPAIQSGAKLIEIPPHQGAIGVARHLRDAGVIRSQLGFLLLTTLRGSARSLKAGEYEIPKDVNTIQILRFLEEGKVLQHTVLFFEGGTVRELARILEAQGLARAEDVLRASQDPPFLRALGIEAPSLEGYLFPDTYQLFKGLTAEEMLARMVQRLRVKLTEEVRAQAQRRGLTLHQLLTLASIIEREAVMRDELPLISAVFWNRMKRDMPLQADPTVQYALGKDRRAITREDLLVDSPFNTYRYPGLPPGPIASPGQAAILAALNPANVKYLYFVSMDDRRHFFSATLEEHNSAVARYRLARAR